MSKPCPKCGGTERTASRNCVTCKRISDRKRAREKRALSRVAKTARSNGRGRKHLYVPDTQIRPGVPINQLYWIAYYAMDKEVDVVVLAGDWYDMPSLSSYDKRGSKAAEGKRVAADLDAGDRGLEIVHEIWDKRGFKPEQHITEGNHENRRTRAIDEHPHLLDGILREFKFEQYGWISHEFLKPVMVDGIRYAHFFPHAANGSVCQTKRGAPSARAQIQRQMCSATAGHKQGLDVAIVPTDDGLRRGLIAGSAYLHDEGYMGPLNNYWRGVVLKHNVVRGNYNACEVDLGFLETKYRRFEPAGRKAA